MIGFSAFGLGLLISNAWFLLHESIDRPQFATAGTFVGAIERTLTALASALVIRLGGDRLARLATVLTDCLAILAMGFILSAGHGRHAP